MNGLVIFKHASLAIPCGESNYEAKYIIYRSICNDDDDNDKRKNIVV